MPSFRPPKRATSSHPGRSDPGRRDARWLLLFFSLIAGATWSASRAGAAEGADAAREGGRPASLSASSRNLVAEQAQALREQDTAVCLDKLGRGAEALAHYRAAIALDPLLKGAWGNLAAHALSEDEPGQALFLANIALSLDPRYETASSALASASAVLPSALERESLVGGRCDPDGADSPPSAGAEPVEACLERRAGMLAGSGPKGAAALVDLGRFEMHRNRPATAVLLLTVAQSLGGGDSELLGRAREGAGDRCAIAYPQADEPGGPACEALRTRSRAAEEILGNDFAQLDSASRASAGRRIELMVASGLDPAQAASAWRFERQRGGQPLQDPGPLTLRLGAQWFEARQGEEGSAAVWRRRPGDAAVVAFVLAVGGDKAEGVLQKQLDPRRPSRLSWTTRKVAATDPVTVRFSPVTLDADAGGRAEGMIWLAEFASIQGVVLVVAGFPGPGGLGREGIEQSRQEILAAMDGAVLTPGRWPSMLALRPGDPFPVPVAGLTAEGAGDERETPWRTFPAGAFSLALPPGMVATTCARAPLGSAPDRESAVLWMRGRFVDRDGLRVRVGDTAHAGTVDVTAFTDPAAAKALVMKTLREAVPPAGEPSVTWIKSVDVTKILGPETGASAASISRFKSASGGMEWLVARLAYDSSLVEISLPVLEGGRSIALYWIASTVRAAHDPQPAPPVDLSNRLGITFFRPPPADRTEAFYKQGDLRSKDFTMLVARDYYVNLNSDAPDAFPAKLSHAAGNALVRLDRWEAGGGSAGASEPAGGRTGFDSGRLESSIRAWLSHEGFDLEGSLSESPIEKLARQGASRGDRISFKARRRPGSDGAASRPGGAASDVSGAQSALGEGAIYEAEDGKTYLFLSLRWDPDAQERAEEIHLMMRSLRFFAKAKS